MSPSATLTIFCVLILLASLAGGWIPLLVNLTHKRMELAVSFVAGVMLGVGLLIMLPHAFMAAMENNATDGHSHDSAHMMAHDLVGPIMLWLLAGFLVMFLIERYFCFHHHDAPPSQSDNAGEVSGHDHGHAHCAHHHQHAHSRHHVTWAGAAIGLTLHSLIDGIALAASVQVAAGHHQSSALLPGLGAFLVIFLHKPFDSLTLGTLLAVGNHSKFTRHVVNAAFSLLIPAGIALFYLGLTAGPNAQGILAGALAFSAGTFLCIAMSDLLPELQFHQHDRFKLSAALVLGLAVAWGVASMEARLHEEPSLEHAEPHDHAH
jgi:zinc and cadmium transporter